MIDDYLLPGTRPNEQEPFIGIAAAFRERFGDGLKAPVTDGSIYNWIVHGVRGGVLSHAPRMAANDFFAELRSKHLPLAEYVRMYPPNATGGVETWEHFMQRQFEGAARAYRTRLDVTGLTPGLATIIDIEKIPGGKYGRRATAAEILSESRNPVKRPRERGAN